MEHSSSSFSVAHHMIFPSLTHMHFARPQLHLIEFFFPPSFPYMHQVNLDCRNRSSPLILILTAHHLTVSSPTHTCTHPAHPQQCVPLTLLVSVVHCILFPHLTHTCAHFAYHESHTPLSSFSQVLTLLLFSLHMQIQTKRHTHSHTAHVAHR